MRTILNLIMVVGLSAWGLDSLAQVQKAVAPVSPPAKGSGAGTPAGAPAQPGVAMPRPAASQLPAGSVLLTDVEAKDLHIAVLENQNLELRIQALEAQVSYARAKSAAEHDALTEKLAKPHNVDLTKFRLNPDLKAFVPIAPEKK